MNKQENLKYSKKAELLTTWYEKLEEIYDNDEKDSASFEKEVALRYISEQIVILEGENNGDSYILSSRYIHCLESIVSILTPYKDNKDISLFIDEINLEIKKFSSLKEFNELKSSVSEKVNFLLEQNLDFVNQLYKVLHLLSIIDDIEVANNKLAKLIEEGRDTIGGFLYDLEDDFYSEDNLKLIQSEKDKFFKNFVPKFLDAFEVSCNSRVVDDNNILIKISSLGLLVKSSFDDIGFSGLNEKISNSMKFTFNYDLIEKLVYNIGYLENIIKDLNKTVRYRSIVMVLKKDIKYFQQILNKVEKKELNYSNELLVEITERFLITLEWVADNVNVEGLGDDIKIYVKNIAGDIKREFEDSGTQELDDLSNMAAAIL